MRIDEILRSVQRINQSMEDEECMFAREGSDFVFVLRGGMICSIRFTTSKFGSEYIIDTWDCALYVEDLMADDWIVID